MILARNTAIHASLWYSLKFHPDQIARLTLRQIHELAWHARNDKGEIVFPEVEMRPADKELTPEQKIAAIKMLAGALGLSPEVEAAKAEAVLKAKTEPLDSEPLP